MPDHAAEAAADLTTMAEAVLTIQRELPRVVRQLYQPPPSLGLAQLRVLGELRRRGPLHVSDLAEVLQVRLPTMTQSLDRLERQGWARRSVGATDRRNVLVRLTAEGERVYGTVYAEVIARLAERLATLRVEERAALTTMLSIIERLRQE